MSPADGGPFGVGNIRDPRLFLRAIPPLPAAAPAPAPVPAPPSVDSITMAGMGGCAKSTGVGGGDVSASPSAAAAAAAVSGGPAKADPPGASGIVFLPAFGERENLEANLSIASSSSAATSLFSALDNRDGIAAAGGGADAFGDVAGCFLLFRSENLDEDENLDGDGAGLELVGVPVDGSGIKEGSHSSASDNSWWQMRPSASAIKPYQPYCGLCESSSSVNDRPPAHVLCLCVCARTCAHVCVRVRAFAYAGAGV